MERVPYPSPTQPCSNRDLINIKSSSDPTASKEFGNQEINPTGPNPRKKELCFGVTRCSPVPASPPLAWGQPALAKNLSTRRNALILRPLKSILMAPGSFSTDGHILHRWDVSGLKALGREVERVWVDLGYQLGW